MTHPLTFGTVEFRNGIYQGFKSDLSPEGIGIFMDDDLALHCSIWKASQLNNHTAILLSHGKYLYGEWSNGLPHGFNVFRSGETVILGNFQHGKINEEFIVIFEKQNFVIIVYPTDKGISVSEKRQFRNEVQLKKIISNALDNFTLEEEYFSFVKYLNSNFCSKQGMIRLFFDNGVYHFGYQNGLGVVFDDDNFISKLGYIDDQDQMYGLGVLYSKVNQIGNFSNGLIIKYRQEQRPTQDIKKLFKNQHKRSIYFRNDFMFTKTSQVIQYLQYTMKSVIKIISENPIDTQRSITRQQLNQSMQYRPKLYKPSQENQRLRMIRQQLHKSIGLPINIKPTPFDNKHASRSPEQIKQLHFTRLNQQEFEEPESISFAKINGKEKMDNRRSFIKDNRLWDYRDDVQYQKSKVSHTYEHQPYDKHSKLQTQKSNKSISQVSNKQKSPVRSKYQIEKSPSRYQIHKQQQMSTAHKNNRRQQMNQPVVDYNPKIFHTNKKEEDSFDQQIHPLEDSLESPYRKHLFNDSVRDSNHREMKKNSSREYIPILHNKGASLKSPKSPQKRHKQSKQIKQFPPKEFKELEKQPRSNIGFYKNISPQKSPQKYSTNMTSKNRVSPLKNPYYQRQAPEPVVYTKQPIRSSNPYLKRSQQVQKPRQSPEGRSKMMDKINKKYNYVYDNL